MEKNNYRVRNYMFTWNNPEEDSESALDMFRLFHQDMTYIRFQLEIGETGTPHFQGYIEYNRAITISTLRKRIPINIHWEPRRGTQKQAIEYVWKIETSINDTQVEWGTPKEQGKRTDLYQFRDEIKSGTGIMELLETYPIQMAIYPKFYRLCRSIYTQHYENKDKQVILCIGPPRSGKTKFAREYNPNSYWIAPIATRQWFDGYEGQQIAIFDDYGLDGTVYKLVDLLRLTHTWTEVVPVKGGFATWNPDVIIITTNYHPLLWYKLNADFDADRIERWISYEALWKRFTKVMLFTDRYTDPKELPRNKVEAFMYDDALKYQPHQSVPYHIYEGRESNKKIDKEYIIKKLSTDEVLKYPNIILKSENPMLYNYSDESDENTFMTEEEYNMNIMAEDFQLLDLYIESDEEQEKKEENTPF